MGRNNKDFGEGTTPSLTDTLKAYNSGKITDTEATELGHWVGYGPSKINASGKATADEPTMAKHEKQVHRKAGLK